MPSSCDRPPLAARRTPGDVHLHTFAHQPRAGILSCAARASALAVVLTCLAILVGCGPTVPRPLVLMPAPATFEAGSLPPGAAVPVVYPNDVAALDMLYVTNRAPATAPGAEGPYSGERGYLLRVGAASIAFGDAHIDWARAREISLLKNRPSEFPLKVTAADEFGVLQESVTLFTPAEIAATVDGSAERRLKAEIRARLARSPVKDIFLYVHGYKVTFENPLLVSSELWHFLGYEGAFVAFSWPSTPASLAYFKDIETARLSAQGLRTLLEFLARETDAERIHILGYSAGTRVVLTALYELALLYQDRPHADIRAHTRLGHVILVGSDIDTDLFASYLLDGLLRVPGHLTFYTSPTDEALHISSRVFAHRRMGELLPGMLDEQMREFVAHSPKLALINVEGAANYDAGNGHAYFRQSPWVSSDVLMTLRYGLGPAARGLEQHEGSPIWRFPVDYVTRSGAALARVNPALATPGIAQ
jgi:esterase/lipase superfamily enzyme